MRLRREGRREEKLTVSLQAGNKKLCIVREISGPVIASYCMGGLGEGLFLTASKWAVLLNLLSVAKQP